ncbi:hypothetical protein [Jiangella alkaliphila]|uniref:Uncharacterized protein n=1 Tax=Jiangella alkaliphila TaxID=419479 RepID=A0A1H2LNG6_9ACTN|nr:hypothetical protein [Jiangella alkaliphila]SDU82131.1 hypothetical protein SAMN04488563_6395 [Jiangella alkaliphila]
MTVFSSITIAGLEDLVARMQVSLSTVMDFTGHPTGRSVRSDMDGLDVSSRGFEALDRVQDWIDDEALPDLTRRLNLARVLENQQPGALTVQLDEALVERMSTSTAEASGRELAIALKDLGGVNEGFDELMAELEELADDPDAMSAFYAELGPEAAAMLAGSIGMPDGGAGANAQRYLELMSQGLSTALLDADHPDGWGAMYEFHQPTDDPMVAWGRLALLQYGNFSGPDAQSFVQGTVNGTALDAFAGEDWADPANISAQSLTPSDTTTAGLPSDITAMAFTVLSRYPTMATEVLTGQDISVQELFDRVDLLSGSPPDRHSVADAFGLAIEAGVGAEGTPPRTEHSPEENELAFEFISAVGRHREVPASMRDSLGRVAAAYVDEMVAGSFVDPGERPGRRDPSMTDAPADFPGDAGLTPSFYLTPDVVYLFVGGFQDQLETSMPFDTAMSTLMDTQLNASILADHATDPPGTRTADLMSLFGGMSSLHYEARRNYAADFDAQQREIRDGLAKFYSAGLGLIPVPGSAHLPYWALQIGTGEGLAAWVDGEGTEGQVVADNVTEEHMRWYLIAEKMIQNGVGADALASAPAGLLENGQLRPMNEIFADDALADQFYDWVNPPTDDAPPNELNESADEAQQGWTSGWGEAENWLEMLDLIEGD